MSDSALALNQVSSGYGATHVLEDISFKLLAGQRLAIVGRNGVGKTTLLSTIMGLNKLHQGSILVDGHPITKLATHKRARIGLGLVPQTRDIFPSLSVEENLLAAQHSSASLEEVYDLFPRLKERRRNGGGQLSGGEQQMLAIARTLLTKPRILLLDEPLEGLAPVIRDNLMRVFEQLAIRQKLTLVLVEQHADMALAFADYGLLLDSGRIVQYGPANEMRDNTALLERYIGVGLKATEEH